MSGDRSMNAAEKLNQKGIIVFPRTETEKFGPSMLVGLHCSSDNPDISSFATMLMNKSQFDPRFR